VVYYTLLKTRTQLYLYRRAAAVKQKNTRKKNVLTDNSTAPARWKVCLNYDHQYPLLYYYEYKVCYTMYNCMRVDYRLTHPSLHCSISREPPRHKGRDEKYNQAQTNGRFWISTFWDGVPKTCSLFFNFVQICYVVEIFNYFDDNKNVCNVNVYYTDISDVHNIRSSESKKRWQIYEHLNF